MGEMSVTGVRPSTDGVDAVVEGLMSQVSFAVFVDGVEWGRPVATDLLDVT
jgi:hypothetical protein